MRWKNREQRAGPKEINVTIETVKRHTINIYKKLSINSRWQVVGRAKNLEIL